MKGATEIPDHEVGLLEKERASRSLVGRCYSFGVKRHLPQESFEGSQEDDNLTAKLKFAFLCVYVCLPLGEKRPRTAAGVLGFKMEVEPAPNISHIQKGTIVGRWR